MNKYKNKWIFIIAILVIILCIIIYSNKDEISELIGINVKDVYNSTNNNVCKKGINKNILAIYDYNDTVVSGADGYCVDGSESTCKEASCVSNIINNGWFINDCKAGSIVKYKVNDFYTVYFYVLHDDGDTMTLQANIDSESQISNDLYSTWGDSVLIGPINPLSIVTTLTEKWTNVNDLNYSLGETSFLKYPNNIKYANSYTYCGSPSGCSQNYYTLSSNLTTKVKARIISVQEAADLGCTDKENSCPTWMWKDISSKARNYWTINTASSSNGAASVWEIRFRGNLQRTYNNSTEQVHFAKAVVEINK
jgi:hypothetical protein